MQEKILQTRLEKTLTRYVAMHTVPNDVVACSAAIKSLSNEFERLGMSVHIDGPQHPWLIATSTPQAMKRKRVKVLFVIHFDIVPIENEGQLTMRATKDKIYGRGVYDMKFAAACCKELIQDLAHERSLQAYDIGILITTDEEKGGYDGAYDFLQKGWRCDIAVVPDGGWNWSIEERAKGLIYLYLHASGRSAHSSRPWTGENPISKLAPAIHEITQQFHNTDPLGLTASINSLETSNGAITNTTQIPSWAKAGISVRAYTHEELDAARTFIEEAAKKHGVTTSVTLQDSPVHLVRDNELVQVFISTAEEVDGKPIEFTDALAASDARHFAKFDVPTVLMYPRGGDHHGPEEWIVREDLYKYFLLCKKYVQKVARTEGNTPRKLQKYTQLFKTLRRSKL